MHSGISSSESELTTDNEEQSVRRSRAGSGVMCSTLDRELDGEQILFPESDGEESDWIESDSEDTGVDALISTGCVDRVEHDREDLVGRSDLVRCLYVHMLCSMHCSVYANVIIGRAGPSPPTTTTLCSLTSRHSPRTSAARLLVTCTCMCFVQ